jgi:hypothetical protein
VAVSKGVWLLMLAAAGGAAAGPFLLGGQPPELLANRDRIAQMSPSQRERLNQRFQSYLALPPEERDRLRQLHRDVVADQAATTGVNVENMDSYVAWTATLPAYSREELKKRAVPGDRFDEMRRIIDEQRQRQIDVPGGPEGGPGRKFSPPDLSKLMPVVDRHLDPFLTAEEQDALNPLKGGDRNAMSIALLSSRLHPRQASQVWSPALLKDLADASQREFPRGPMDPERRLMPYVAVDLMLLQAARQELMRETATQRVSDADLKARFEALPPAEQEDLTRLSADDFRTSLRLMHLSSNREALQRLESEFRRIRHEFNLELMSRPGERQRPGDGFRGPGGPDGRERSPREDGRPDGAPPRKDDRPRDDDRPLDKARDALRKND